MKKRTLLTFLILVAVLASCKNSKWSFPDYKYQSVYFAYQYPVRTITLGTSYSVDNTLDNNHEFKIYATTAGVYNNTHDVIVNFKVDTTLTDSLLFNAGGQKIKPMPASYYTLTDSKIVIPKGSLVGGVMVHLTDKFFADTTALKTTYVIPMKMTSVVNADTILSGQAKPTVSDPRLAVASDWSIEPKNFTFYAVKYMNQWDGYYLRGGKDVITGAMDTTIERDSSYVTKDQVVELTSKSLTEVNYPVTYKDQNGKNFNVMLDLKFNSQGNCTVSGSSSKYTASGSGKFVKDGAKNSWGGKDRDAIYLSYKVDSQSKNLHIQTADTLVLRDRGVTMQTFSPVQE